MEVVHASGQEPAAAAACHATAATRIASADWFAIARGCKYDGTYFAPRVNHGPQSWAVMLNELRQLSLRHGGAAVVAKTRLIEDTGVGCFPNFQATGSG